MGDAPWPPLEDASDARRSIPGPFTSVAWESAWNEARFSAAGAGGARDRRKHGRRRDRPAGAVLLGPLPRRAWRRRGRGCPRCVLARTIGHTRSRHASGRLLQCGAMRNH